MNHSLKSLIVAAVLFFGMALVGSSGAAQAAQEAGKRPDLIVRLLEVQDKHLITVYVLNRGSADALGSYVELSVSDASAKTPGWSKRFAFDPVPRGVTVNMVYDLAPLVAEAGMVVRATIDSSARIAEEDETNNTRELVVPAAKEPAAVPKPAPITIGPPPPPPPPPAPIKIAPAPPKASGPPKISVPPPPPTDLLSLRLGGILLPDPAPAPNESLAPDVAATAIQFGATHITGVVKNVGDRDFHALDAKIKDSFKRTVTLKRVARVGATNVTEDLGTRLLGDLGAGKTVNYAFPLPKSVPGATQYTWTLAIDGQDPNAKNNTFTKVSQVTKID